MKYKIALFMLFAAPFFVGLAQHFQTQAKVSDALNAAEQKFAEIHRKNEIRYNEIQSELVELYKKENPSKHDLWYIGHLEKTSKNLEKSFETRKKNPTTKLTRTQLENAVMVIMLIGGLLSYFLLQARTSNEHPAPKGLGNHTPWTYPNNDAVADNTHWQPMKSGGANFKTHKLIQTAQKIILQPSGQLTIFYGLFIAIGLNNVIFNYLEIIYNDGVQPFIDNPGLIFSQWITVGTTFVIIGFALRALMTPSAITFDLNKQQLFVDNTSLPFSQLHALQVIEEMAGGHGSGVYNSYEMNIVMKDGERIHLMDHGDLSAFTTQVTQLSNALGLPVWKA